jgi:hypothetical protein
MLLLRAPALPLRMLLLAACASAEYDRLRNSLAETPPMGWR